MRAHAILTVYLTASPLLQLATPAAADQPRTRPNIILCMADDQGWGDVGYNGHPVLKTPHLDEMAASGMRFDRFYAAAPVCSPTRGSVMTGRHPNRFGCFSWGHTLRPQEVTIAEALKRAGYATAHFGKWHLGSVQKGSPVNPGASGFDAWLSAPNFYDNDPILSREGVAVPLKGESSMVAVDGALEFIRKQRSRPEPFLAVIWFGSPHNPYQAAEEDASLYANQEKKLQQYYGEITGLDRAMGRLRAKLREFDIHDNTLVWYCSDNGGVAGVSATGGRGHKGQIYEGGLRVPAIIEWPAKIKTPARTSLPAVTSDIYPTLLEVAGVKPDRQPPLDGTSLVRAMDGQMKTRRAPIGFWSYPARGLRTPSAEWMGELLEAQKSGREVTSEERLRLEAGKISRTYPETSLPGHAAWLDWPWKLHRIEGTEGEIKLELYNLDDDPQEAENLATQQGPRVGEMRRELEKWLQSVVRSLNGEDYPA